MSPKSQLYTIVLLIIIAKRSLKSDVKQNYSSNESDSMLCDNFDETGINVNGRSSTNSTSVVESVGILKADLRHVQANGDVAATMVIFNLKMKVSKSVKYIFQSLY